jgi:hypothetical protein
MSAGKISNAARTNFRVLLKDCDFKQAGCLRSRLRYLTAWSADILSASPACSYIANSLERGHPVRLTCLFLHSDSLERRHPVRLTRLFLHSDSLERGHPVRLTCLFLHSDSLERGHPVRRHAPDLKSR